MGTEKAGKKEWHFQVSVKNESTGLSEELWMTVQLCPAARWREGPLEYTVLTDVEPKLA